MDLDTIEQLIELVDQSSITDLEIQDNELTIRISKASTADCTHATSGSSAAATTPRRQTTSRKNPKKLFRSPMVGSFHRSSGDEDAPLIKEGDQVIKGQPLCIIEAMKMLNMVESDRDGVIEEILVDTGQAVEFGQPLFVITD